MLIYITFIFFQRTYTQMNIEGKSDGVEVVVVLGGGESGYRRGQTLEGRSTVEELVARPWKPEEIAPFGISEVVVVLREG